MRRRLYRTHRYGMGAVSTVAKPGMVIRPSESVFAAQLLATVNSYEATSVDQLTSTGKQPWFGVKASDGKEGYYVHPQMGRTIWGNASRRSDLVKGDVLTTIQMAKDLVLKSIPKASLPDDPKAWPAWIHSRLAASVTTGGYNNLARAKMILLGRIPFEGFEDQTGKHWVKAYSIERDEYTFTDKADWEATHRSDSDVQKVFSAIGGFFKAVGRYIAKGARWVWRKLKELVGWVCEKIQTPMGQALAIGVGAAAGVPPQAMQTGAGVASILCPLLKPSSAPTLFMPTETSSTPPWLLPVLIGGGLLVFMLSKRGGSRVREQSS